MKLFRKTSKKSSLHGLLPPGGCILWSNGLGWVCCASVKGEDSQECVWGRWCGEAIETLSPVRPYRVCVLWSNRLGWVSYASVKGEESQECVWGAVMR